jgi:predicted transcriptional regulator
MSKQEIQPEISRILGLTKQENKIMWAISDMAKHISDIARITKLPRTSLLYILKNLEKRNLVRSLKNKKYTYWKSNTINAFRMLKNTASEIVVHNGVPAMTTIFDRLINQPRNSRIKGIQPDKSLKFALKKFDSKILNTLNSAIRDNKFIMEGIVHEKSVNNMISDLGHKKAKQVFDSFVGRLEDYVKIPDDFADVESEMYIFGGSAYIFNWNKEIALEINNKDMVALLDAMFSCVKELGTRYSQNKKMEATLPNTLR